MRKSTVTDRVGCCLDTQDGPSKTNLNCTAWRYLPMGVQPATILGVYETNLMDNFFSLENTIYLFSLNKY